MNQSIQYEIDAVMPTALASGLFVSECSIYRRPNTVSSAGQPNLSPASYVPVAGLQNLECMKAMQRPTLPNTTATVRTQQQYDTLTNFHTLLNGYYPSIQQQHLAQVDGIFYEIMAVEPDSQRTQTRLAMRIFTL